MISSPSSDEVLGIGTPIIDQLVNVSHEFIRQIPGAIGGSESVENIEFLENLIKNSGQTPIFQIGGSAANTIKGLAHLGQLCSFVGKIGNDEFGKKFQTEIESLGVTSKLLSTDLPTAQVACLISPDYERTMRFFLGAGSDLKAIDLSRELFFNSKLIHIEGFQLEQESVVEQAIKLAKDENAKISFDISSFEIAYKYKKQIIDLLSNSVDIVFANEAETQALTGLVGEEGCTVLKDICEVAIVKMGAKGCWVGRAQEKAFHPAFKVNTIDTTGAGDFFASGFLYGFLNQKSLLECARYGALVASYVVQVIGTELSYETWKKIKKEL